MQSGGIVALVSPVNNTMQLFMWQHETVGVALHWIALRSLVPCLTLLIVHHPQLHQPWHTCIQARDADLRGIYSSIHRANDRRLVRLVHIQP